MRTLASHTPGRVVFHCPACGTDRVGIVREGQWRDGVSGGELCAGHVTCTGCGIVVAAGGVGRAPTGLSATARLHRAVRSLAAAVAMPRADDPATISAAVGMVRRYHPSAFGAGDLRADIADPGLGQRLRGDLVLLAEEISAETATIILRAAVDVACVAGPPTPSQRRLLEAAADYLGVEVPALPAGGVRG